MKTEPTAPEPGSVWTHRNGIAYRVLYITNTANPSLKYPPAVVYVTVINGNVWSRPLSTWEGTFTQIS